MKLGEFKSLLTGNADKQFTLALPSSAHVPQSFHITEVGLVSKTFIDCGGKIHTTQTCQLQVWVGDDEDHRLNAGKLARILELSRSIVPDDDLSLEFEYEDGLISQYPVADVALRGDSVTLQLTTKHTDCLAKEICLSAEAACCGGASGGACC